MLFSAGKSSPERKDREECYDESMISPQLRGGRILAGEKGVKEWKRRETATLTFDVAVDAVVRHVELAAREPADVALLKPAVAHGREVLREGELLVRHVCPEGLVLVDRALVHLVVRRHAAHMRAGGDAVDHRVRVVGAGARLGFLLGGFGRHGLCGSKWSRER